MAQDEWYEDEELESVEELILVSLSEYLRPGSEVTVAGDVVESPFTDVWEGSHSEFRLQAVIQLATELAVGDQTPFADAHFEGFSTSYRPPNNDYLRNSPYTVVTTIEVTAPVSGCGLDEYREVALFIARSGLATVGENPAVPNDPGVGATEAVSLICHSGEVSTFHGLAADDRLVQYQTPYEIVETQLGGRHWVSFVTGDPFVDSWVVGSFATDVTAQEQFGFSRVDLPELGSFLTSGGGPLLTESALVDLIALANTAAAEPTEEDRATDTDPVTVADPVPSGSETVDDEANPVEEPEPVDAEPVAEQDDVSIAPAVGDDESGSSAVPAALGAAAAAAAAGAGVAVYRKKKVVLRGANLPMLSDAEEARIAGERAGLPEDRGWQQIPWSVGRSFRHEGSWGTERENIVGDDRPTSVRFDQYPWQWADAWKRGLDMPTYFAYWMHEDGRLKIGSPDNPYYFSELLDSSEFPVDYEEPDPKQPFDREAEGTPMNLDGDKKIPPA